MDFRHAVFLTIWGKKKADEPHNLKMLGKNEKKDMSCVHKTYINNSLFYLLLP